jgi:hypothetical protein
MVNFNNIDKAGSCPQLDYEMSYVGSYRATLTPPEIIGALPSDIRLNFYVTEGEAWGRHLDGIVRPVGGDWLTLRADGVGVLDARTTLELRDGALVDIVYNGIIDLGDEGYEAFLRGEIPEVLQIRAAPRMRTAHPEHLWLNRTQFINIGEARLRQNQVFYDVYALK